MSTGDDGRPDDYRRLLARMEANDAEFCRLGRAVWRVQEDERRRLARDLHDGIGQNLTALKHRLALIGTGVPAGDAALRRRVDDAIALCSATLEDTRTLSRLLRPPILDDLGLAPSLRWLARSLENDAGPRLELELDALPELHPDLQTLLFRVAQEALANAVRHAQASRILLRLQARDGAAWLDVEDDGRGCDPAAALRAGGSGLGGMRERLRLYGGTLHLDASPGAGTRLRARVPLDAA